MKRQFSTFFLLCIIFSCHRGEYSTAPDEKMIYREVAWNSLTAQEKQTVITDWHLAEVSDCQYYTITRQEAVCVTFNTTLDPLLGPIIVYIEKSTYKILGQAPRE